MNKVVIKSINKNLIIHILDNNNFQETLAELEDNLRDIVEIFPDNKFRVILKGENINENQVEDIYDVIEYCGLKISFLGQETFLVKNYADIGTRAVAENSVLQEEIEISTIEKKEFSANENETLFHTGSLRGGTELIYDGSIVIVGDVNAGAKVIATGNIVCMGAFRGLAHAGSKGNKSCYVSALTLIPSQLRISDIITVLPDDVIEKNKNTSAYAYIDDNEIVVTNLTKLKN